MVKNNDEIYLEENYIVLSLPTETVEVEITAKIYHDGAIRKVKKTMNMHEVRDAFNEADEWYLPPDAVFQIKEKGLEALDG